MTSGERTGMMKERPILFNGEMVRAILDGRKTQTRRVIKPVTMKILEVAARAGECSGFMHTGVLRKHDLSYLRLFSPFGQPGDRLWVREAWRVLNDFDRCKPSDVSKDSLVHYQADNGLSYETLIFNHNDGRFGRWRPSIHMPRWASRITLEVRDVRVERVQEISEEDAKAEGDKERSGFPEYHVHGAKCHVNWFRDLWNSINEKRGFGWDENPFVWVVEFKKGQADDQR
jgi:hypothetical protein